MANNKPEKLNYDDIREQAKALEKSQSNLANLFEKLQTYKDAIDDNWAGTAAGEYYEKINTLYTNLKPAEEELAYSILFLSSVTNSYEEIENETVRELLNEFDIKYKSDGKFNSEIEPDIAPTGNEETDNLEVEEQKAEQEKQTEEVKELEEESNVNEKSDVKEEVTETESKSTEENKAKEEPRIISPLSNTTSEEEQNKKQPNESSKSSQSTVEEAKDDLKEAAEKNKESVTDNKPSPSSNKSIDELAEEVINGDWGNGEARRKNLADAGHDYATVQGRVEEILRGDASEMATGTKNIDTLAEEVINGNWGNGEERQKRLAAAGYDYNTVQKKVNEILRGTK